MIFPSEDRHTLRSVLTFLLLSLPPSDRFPRGLLQLVRSKPRWKSEDCESTGGAHDSRARPPEEGSSPVRNSWGSWDCLAWSRLKGDLIILYSHLKGGWGQVWVSIFSKATAWEDKSLKLHQGKLRLGIRKKSFTESVIRLWNGLPREVTESQPLKVF